MKNVYLTILLLVCAVDSFGQTERIDVNGHGQGLIISNSADNGGTYISLIDHDGKKANIASFDDNYADNDFKNSLQFFARNGKDFRFATSTDGNAGNNKFVILNNGNVGIGTTYPSEPLNVLKPTSGVISRFASGDEGRSGVRVQGKYAGSNKYMDIVIDPETGTYGFGAGSYGGQLPINAGFEKADIVVDANGKVGINQADPESSLHVNGDFYLHGGESYSSGWGITRFNWKGHSLIMGTKPGRYAHNKLELKPGGSSQGTLNSSLELFNAPSENEHELTVRVSSDGESFFNGGNVGIGTQDPGSYKLNVVGKMRANEIVVNTTGADYVFESDYKLKPLNEVESFIHKNGHLPDIPSAAEMQEDGMEVGELQKLLLQKVEELTLYVIELKKENEELKNAIKK